MIVQHLSEFRTVDRVAVSGTKRSIRSASGFCRRLGRFLVPLFGVIAATVGHAQITQDFEDPAWPSTVGTHTNQNWVIHRGRVLSITGYPTRRAWLESEVGAFVRSEFLPNGAENLSFIARNFASGTITFSIDVSEDEQNWTTVDSGSNSSFGSDGVDTQHSFALNIYNGAYVRVRRTNAGGATLRLGLDDFLITEPPSNVIIRDLEISPNVLYVSEPVAVSVEIEPSFGASNITASVFYRYNNGIWAEIPLSPASNDRFETAGTPIPPEGLAGQIDLYVRAEFYGPGNDPGIRYYPAGAPAAFTSRVTTAAMVVEDLTLSPDPPVSDLETGVEVRIEKIGPSVSNRTAMVWYRFDEEPFQSVPLYPGGGNIFATDPLESIPAAGQSGLSLEFYVEVEAEGFDAVALLQRFPETAPAEVFLRIVQPGSLAETMAVDGSAYRDLRLIEDYVWQGAVQPDVPLTNPQFWFTDGSLIWGDDAAPQWPPALGTAVENQIFDFSGSLDTPLLFRINETNRSYAVRHGEYAPFDGWADALFVGYGTARTNDAGWVLQGGQVVDDPDQTLEGWSASLRFDGTLDSFVQSPPLTDGAGFVGFWYRRAPDATVPAAILVQKFDVDAADWMTVGVVDSIQNDRYRYAEIPVGDVQTPRVRILAFNDDLDSRVLLDEVFVTRSGAGVLLSNPQRDPASPNLGEPTTVRIDAIPVGGATNLQARVHVRLGTTGPFDAFDMAEISGGFEGVIPALSAGTVQYFFEVFFDGIDAVPVTWPANAREDDNYLSYTVGTTLGSDRFQDFEDPVWPSTVGTHTNQNWVIHQGRVLSITGYPTRRGWLESEGGAYVRSPFLAHGAGTLYFRARNFASGTINFDIQVSPDGGSWSTLYSASNVTFKTDGEDTWHQFSLNVYTPIYVRILRTNAGGATLRLGLDDITVSPPPADVSLAERLYQPGYPNQQDPVRLRVLVQDRSPIFPSINRQLRAYYRPEGQTTWSWVAMDPVGANVYEGVVPPQLMGRVDYYFRCAFDGFYYTHTPTATSEATTPRFLPLSPSHPTPPEAQPLSYMVRPFRSVNNRAEVIITDPADDPAHMVLVGDNEWDVAINVSGLTNLNFRLMTQGLYTNNATAYHPIGQFWGDSQQATPGTPLAGFMQFGGEDLAVTLDHPGFLLVRFNELTGEYIVKLAFFQDFDNWQASPQYFEDSLGLFAFGIFDLDFDDWPKDVVTGDQRSIEDFQLETEVDPDYLTDPYPTTKFWMSDDSRRILERLYEPPEDDQIRNRAVQLSNIAPGLGTVWNSGQALTEGVDTFTFRYRAALQDEQICWYRGSVAFPDSYIVDAKIRADAISRGETSLSIFVMYQDAFNYYEYRLVQDHRAGTPAQNLADDRLRAQIWRNVNGSKTMLTQTDPFPGVLTLGTYLDVRVTVEDLGTSIKLTGRVGTTDRGTVTDDSAILTWVPKTIGFLGRDAVMMVDQVIVRNLSETPVLTETFAGLADWDTAGFRSDNGQPRWTTSAGRLTRPVPTQTFYVDTAPTNNASASGPDPLLWQQHSARTVSSLAFQEATITIRHWDKAFVRIRQSQGDCPIVVDNLRIEPWRGRTREVDDWKVTEAWIAGGVKGSEDHEVLLYRSRANPAVAQALTTPLLNDGMGSIGFNYQVVQGPSVFAVERTVENDLSAWVPVAVHTNNTGVRESFYIPIRETFPGRLRVRHLSSSAPSAVLRIDDVAVRDFPLTDDPTWKAYNALITEFAPGDDERRMFPIGRPEAKSAFLNDDPEDDTPPNMQFDEDLPYIQSPIIENMGIGEISFWYRAWEPLAVGEPGKIYIKVAPGESGPWNLVDTLSGITNSTYRYYRNQIFDRANKVVRFYAETNQTQRVALDNMLIAEPVQSGFDILDVSIWPEQPEDDDDVYVEARLDNFMMNPQNIQVYTLYYVGTNGWGLANWPVTNVVQMTQIEPNRYRTQLNTIPRQNVDDVVQYTVWATYQGQFATPIKQTAFDHPAWYHPVDLNQTFAPDWSPYYFVYACPPGAVWINEVNYADRGSERDNEYVELVGPAGTRIDDWRIELIDPNTVQPFVGGEVCVVAPDTTLSSVTNGWGFFVWGDAQVPNVDQTFSLAYVNNMPLNSGIRLVRSMGAWEHRIAYGASNAAQNMPGYKHIGAKWWLQNGPIHLTGTGAAAADFNWVLGQNNQFTPGGMNVNQNLLPIVAPFPQLDELVIYKFRIDGNQVRIETQGTNQWRAIAWYRTNLTLGAWEQVPGHSWEYSGGQFLLLFDRQTHSPVYFYRITAEPNP